MKINNLIILLLGILSASSCKNKDELKANTPGCLETHIANFENGACKSGAKAEEYMFQGEVVYVLRPGDCGNDMSSEVVGDDCQIIGYLGGISGNTTINGEEFESNAQFLRVVWEQVD